MKRRDESAQKPKPLVYSYPIPKRIDCESPPPKPFERLSPLPKDIINTHPRNAYWHPRRSPQLRRGGSPVPFKPLWEGSTIILDDDHPKLLPKPLALKPT